MDNPGGGESAADSGRRVPSRGPGMRFNPITGQFEKDEEEGYMGPINEIQKRINDLVAAQAKEKDDATKKKTFADAHKKMVMDLADQLRTVAANNESRVIEDAIFALLPPVADDSASDVDTVKARATLAYHDRVMSVEMPQEVIDRLLGCFRVGYLHPIIYDFLINIGSGKDNAHKLMMYVAKVLNILYSPALLEILQKAYSATHISDEDYIEIVKGLNLLVKYTCSSIHKNDTFSSKLIGYLEGLELNDLIAALKKIAGMTVAVLTIDELYPGLFPLFSLGCKATGLVITYVMLAPGILFVHGSFVVSDWNGTCEKVVAAKNAIISCIPPNQLNQVPPPVAAAQPDAAAAQPVNEHMGALPAVARDCQAAADRISALSADAVVHPGVSFFRDNTLAASFEGAFRRIIQTSAQVLGGAANILRNNPVTTVARSATTHVIEFVEKIVTGMRDSQCARKQHAEGTYEDNVSLLELLLTDINKFPENMHENVNELIYYLSYKTRFLSESMVKYLIALDEMTHRDDMFPLGKREKLDPHSQTVAGSPEGNFVQRAVELETSGFPVQIEETPMGNDPREIRPFSVFKQKALPKYSPREFELWGEYLLRLHATGQAAPPDEGAKWTGSEDKPLIGPFARLHAQLGQANPQFADPVRLAADMPELDALLEKFNKAAATALNTGTPADAVTSAKAASRISQVAACARGGGGAEDVSVGSDSDDDDGMNTLAEAAAKARSSLKRGPSPPPTQRGKSRRKSRKNSKKTTKRNKGRKSSKTAKKSQQQRARNSIRRRRSSHKGRK